VMAAGEQVLLLSVITSPEAAYRETVTLPATVSSKPLEIDVLDRSDQVVLSYQLP